MVKAWIIKPKTVEVLDKTKLDIELFAYGDTVLIGRILHQDKSLGKAGEPKCIYSKEGFFVSSYDSPGISYEGLYIRGIDKEKDNDSMCCKFSSSEVLKRYVCNVKKALAEINNKGSKASDEVSDVFKRLI